MLAMSLKLGRNHMYLQIGQTLQHSSVRQQQQRNAHAHVSCDALHFWVLNESICGLENTFGGEGTTVGLGQVQ